MKRNVILTFDDMARSQFDNALPILDRFHFGGTFFTMLFPEAHTAQDSYSYTAEELRSFVSQPNREVGNHTAYHMNFRDATLEQIAWQVETCEKHITSHGFPHPTVFAYPGGPGTAIGLEYLRTHGYIGARSNVHRVYHPRVDNPLDIPGYPVADKFPGIFEQALQDWDNDPDEDAVLVLIYHGIPDRYPEIATQPAAFARQMQTLAERGCRTWCLGNYLKTYKDILPTSF